MIITEYKGQQLIGCFGLMQMPRHNHYGTETGDRPRSARRHRALVLPHLQTVQAGYRLHLPRGTQVVADVGGGVGIGASA